MKLFSYDDITLIPKYSELESRTNADTSLEFLGIKGKLPVIPANMADVISIELAKQLADYNYFYIMHRFGNMGDYDQLDNYKMSISVGINDCDKEFLNNFVFTPHWICVDVAHAHHLKVERMLKFLYNLYKGESYSNRPKFIVGNVATAEGYKFLCENGADAVKISIGSGSICTTRYQTGFYVPSAYSVWECAQLKLGVPIIADGGAKHYGDVAKALTLGATAIMSGGWFASCIDSPAKIVHGKKLYRGSTSYEAKKQRKHIEGRTLELDEGITYIEKLEEIKQALCSSISYAGGKDLSAFNSVEWKLLKK